ncbi:MAG: YitT family protein, partial [Holdemanella sp.]|nr:YitT family protein [Holdemanella sp.]
GAGLGLVFKANASTGGMDIPALILAKYTSLTTGDATMIVDTLTVLLGILTYGLEPALVGIISVVISSSMINRTILLGAQSAQKVIIISDMNEEIKRYILEDMSRGVTILEGKGAYTNESRQVLMAVVEKKEYPILERTVNAIDPKAFIIVDEVHEIHGSGFTFPDGSL